MRLSLTLPALLLAGCFDPSLGPNPFLCSKEEGKKCPDGYVCKNEICVKEGASDGSVGSPDLSLTDGITGSSKVGTVYLDGAVVSPPGNCADKDSEPNNSGALAVGGQCVSPRGCATELTGQGYIPGWEICYPGDIDQFALPVEVGKKLVIKVKFFHNKGDLEAALVDPDGFVITSGRGETDNEELKVTTEKSGKYVIGVYGFGAAVNTYDLDIQIN